MFANTIYKICLDNFQDTEEYKNFLLENKSIDTEGHYFFMKLLYQLYVFYIKNGTLNYPFIKLYPLSLITVALEIIKDESCDYLFSVDNNYNIKINRNTLNKSISVLSILEKAEISSLKSVYIQVYGNYKQTLTKNNLDEYLNKMFNSEFQLFNKDKYVIIFISRLLEDTK